MQLYIQKIPWNGKWKGLLGYQPKAIFFKTRFGIHTFCMQYPIDVVILDNKNVVKKLKINLQPNRIFLWNPLFDNVLELPENTIQSKKIRLGTKILLNDHAS